MSSAVTLREKSTRWVEQKDWRVVAGAVAAVVLTGVGVWWLTTRDSSDGKSTGKRRLKRRKKTTKKSRDLHASDATATGTDDETVATLVLTDEQVANLTAKERKEHAQTMKTKGNNDYTAKRYEEAVQGYSQAIRFDSEDPVFYANRAACYLSLGRYHDCISDCDAALKRDNAYIKALNRRATARENLMEYEEAVHDYTACCIIDGFQNQSFAMAMERTMKALTDERTKEVLKERKGRVLNIPSNYVVSSYLEGFLCCTPEGIAAVLAELPEEDAAKAGDAAYRGAMEALRDERYADSERLFAEAIDAGCTRQGHALAMQATFLGLRSNLAEALKTFAKASALEPNNLDTVVLRGATLMQMGDVPAASEQFTQGLTIDDSVADLYYNRGQCHFVEGNLEAAIADYKRAIELDDTRSVAYIQLGVAQYRHGDRRASEATFRRASRQFPQSAHVRIFYSELLIDQQRFPDAKKALEEAAAMDPTNALVWVNTALLSMQQAGNIDESIASLHKALEVDPECEAAILSLGQMYMQQGKLSETMTLFERGLEIARTEQEIATMVSYCEATRTQLVFAKRHPALANRLSALHGGAM